MVEPLAGSGAQAKGMGFSNILLLGIFAALVAWSVFRLFLPHAHAGKPAKPSLRPAHTAPDIAELARRIRQTTPVKPRQNWRPEHLSNQWQWIVIHHSGTFSGNAAAFDRYHSRVKHMENGLAYHFVIGNGHGSGDGEIEVGKRWRLQLPGGHVRGEALNRIAIGICMVGDFNEDIPTRKQLDSLSGLLAYLLSITSVDKKHVVGHRDMPGQATICPGVFNGEELAVFLRRIKPAD